MKHVGHYNHSSFVRDTIAFNLTIFEWTLLSCMFYKKTLSHVHVLYISIYHNLTHVHVPVLHVLNYILLHVCTVYIVEEFFDGR